MDEKKMTNLRTMVKLAKQRNELIYAISPDYKGYIPLSGIIFPDYSFFSEKELIDMLNEDVLIFHTKIIEINLKGEVDWKCELTHINPYVYIQAYELDSFIPPSLIAKENVFEKEIENILSFILKEKFKRIENTIWSFEADMFIDWCVFENFQNKSFKHFTKWFKENDYLEFLNNDWSFFYGYNSMITFANDWVDENEQDRYFNFYRKNTILR